MPSLYVMVISLLCWGALKLVACDGNATDSGTFQLRPEMDGRQRQDVMRSWQDGWRANEQDVRKLNPVHVLIAGLAGAALFVALLVVLVKWVVGSGVAT